jgi:chromate transporter
VQPEQSDRVPQLTLPQLAVRFLRFGGLAWGGPIAQIAMLRRELVDEEGWITSDRFNRTLAVYQVLPGPEAQELTIFFGTLARGRLGGLIAGLCFLLPGFVLMLAMSWFYLEVGIGSPVLAAAFTGCQAAVLALIVRGLHRIGSRALHDRHLWLIASASATLGLAGAPFVVPLAGGAACFALAARGRRNLATFTLAAAFALGLGMAVQPPATPAPSTPEAASSPGAATLLASGVRAGALTFGGAYTAIPFVEADATGSDGWMSRDQFLDGLVLSGVIPAPLVIFATFVGYVGGGILGAVAMTLGIFLPAFAITLLGHRYLDAAVAYPPLHAALDGITAGVVGLVAATLLAFAPVAVNTLLGLVTFLASAITLYLWRASIAVPVVVVAGGLVAALFGNR